MEVVLKYMAEYGIILVALISFCEYLNIPGFAAGIVFPAIGIWAKQYDVNLVYVILISVAFSLLATVILYYLGYVGGDFIIKKYIKKFPKQKEILLEKIEYIKNKGNFGVFILRFIPVARTIISVPAGVIKLNLSGYVIYSTIGISIYNLVLIGGGYFCYSMFV